MLPGVLSLLLLFLPTAVLAGNAAEQKLQSVEADFIQHKQLKILAEPLVARGHFAFQAPDSLRWEYVEPVASLLLMCRGTVKKYVRREGRWEEDKTMGLDAVQTVLSEIANWLDGRFRENEMFRVERPDKKSVLLRPKQGGFASLISSIELKLSSRNGQLDTVDGVTLHEGEGSFTRLSFTNRIINRNIPAATFGCR
jgi:hypothetical protein